MKLKYKYKKALIIITFILFIVSTIIFIETEYKKKVDKMNSIKLEVTKKIDGLNDENSKLKIKINELNSNISNLNNQIAELKKTPSQRFSEAIKLFNNKSYSDSEKILRDIIIKYPADKFSKESYNKVRSIYLNDVNNLRNRINTAKSKSDLIQIESELQDLNSNYIDFDKGEYNNLSKTCAYNINNFEKVQRVNYLKTCRNYAYKRLERDASDLNGKAIKFVGQVFTVQKENGVMELQINVTESDYGNWSDQVYVHYDSIADVYKDDIVAVAGEIKGKYTYTSQAGWNITVPLVSAKYVWK